MTGPRMAYYEAGRAVRLSDTGLTAQQLRQAINRIVETWNASIPRNRVRIVNQPRYIDLLGALRVFSPDEICTAIQWYGRQRWQRQRNAWSTFDRFIAEDRLTQWVESSMDRAEKAVAVDDRRRAAKAAGQAKARAVDDATEMRRRRGEAFDALPGPQKHKLLEDAKQILPRSLQRNAAQVRLRAIAIMQTIECQDAGKDSHGSHHRTPTVVPQSPPAG